MSVVMEISDHVVVLDYGVKIADGFTPEAIRNDAKVIAAYLGVDEDAVEKVSRRRSDYDRSASRHPAACSAPSTATSRR